MLKASQGVAVLVFVLALVACSPALNWRTVQFKDAPLQILLPCDAQLAKRVLPMGAAQIEISMMGCEAAQSTYAVSHFLLKDPALAAETLTRWQAAVSAQLHVAAPRSFGADSRFVPKGALNLPQSARTTLEGMGAQGKKLFAHGVWFARLEEGKGVRLYHAVIHAGKPQPEAADTFFAGLQLQQ